MSVAATIDIDPFSTEALADPYRFHDQLRDAAPVLWFPAHGCFGVARYREVRRVMSDWEVFCSSRGVGLADFEKEAPLRKPSLLLERDPPLHTATRAVMNKVVALPRLKALAGTWGDIARELVDEVTSSTRFDAVVELCEEFPLRVFPQTIGLPDGGREHLLAYATSVFNGFGPRNKIFADAQEGLGPALDWIAQACRYENLKPGGWGRDVHDFAANAGLAVEDRELLVRSLLSAGVDTTINGLGNLLYAFSLHNEQWAKLRDDRTLVKRAFEEGLRWQGTVQSFFRTTVTDVELDGVPIPEGSKVIAFLGAANRDPRQWSDADDFDITRQASGHVGFGFGIHQCLGQMLARQEAEILLGALVDRISVLEPAGPVVRRLNNTLFALQNLPVAVRLA